MNQSTYSTTGQLQFSPNSAVKILLGAFYLLLLGNLFALVLVHIFSAEDAYGLVPLLYFDHEENLPTLFSVLLIVAASASCFAVAYNTMTRERNYWYALSLIFTFLALDEYSSIHERLIQPVRNILSTDGFFHFAWIIPYAVFVLILAAIFFKWLFNLPRPTRNGLILSAIIYLTGVFILEGISGYFYETGAEHQGLIYDLIITVEESLEMLGLITFLYVVIYYLIHHLDIKGISFQRQ